MEAATQESQGETIGSQDPFAQAAAIIPRVEERRHHGRVKGLGFGARPTQVFRSSPGGRSTNERGSTSGTATQPFEQQQRQRAIDERSRALDERSRAVEEQQRTVEEQQRAVTEQQRTLQEQARVMDERQRAIEQQQRQIAEQQQALAKMLEEAARRGEPRRRRRSPNSSGDDA